jgi:hypothetical protein
MAQFDPDWERALLKRSRQRRTDRLRSLLIQPCKRRQASGAHSLSPQSFTTIFLPFAFSYFLSYVFQTINGPLADVLVRHFSLSASSLGIITSAYFLAFALSAFRSVQRWTRSARASCKDG